MSLILEKRVLFWKKVSGLQKNRLFPGIFTEKGLFSGAPGQCFWKKGVFFTLCKCQWKGYIFILENDHTSPLLHVSGRTGPPALLQPTRFPTHPHLFFIIIILSNFIIIYSFNLSIIYNITQSHIYISSSYMLIIYINHTMKMLGQLCLHLFLL